MARRSTPCRSSAIVTTLMNTRSSSASASQLTTPGFGRRLVHSDTRFVSSRKFTKRLYEDHLLSVQLVTLSCEEEMKRKILRDCRRAWFYVPTLRRKQRLPTFAHFESRSVVHPTAPCQPPIPDVRVYYDRAAVAGRRVESRDASRSSEPPRAFGFRLHILDQHGNQEGQGGPRRTLS